MVKRILEGQSPAERATKRRQFGTLRQLTVQGPTRARYETALDSFLKFLKTNSLTLPSIRDKLDPLVCEYIEHLWSDGQGRARASDTVAALQDHDPKLKGHLPGAWRLLKTWAINEVPNRAPPLPEHVVQAMVGWAGFHQHYGFAISLLVAYYGMLRTGELLACRRANFMTAHGSRQVVLSLGLTKAGKRAGAAESVVLAHDSVVTPLLRWMQLSGPTQYLTSSPAKWRGLFNEALASLKLDSFGFRPYSLRRGGATFWFSKHGSLDKILLQGRWQAVKTARIYLNEGLAVLAEMQLPVTDRRIAPFLTVYRSTFPKPTFATLEPPDGRSGGRGKGSKSEPKKFFPPRKIVKNVVCLLRVGVWLTLCGFKRIFPPFYGSGQESGINNGRWMDNFRFFPSKDWLILFLFWQNCCEVGLKMVRMLLCSHAPGDKEASNIRVP